jgi:ABC-type nitrate/sulfonate/bicarbonate transport system permease component
VAIALFLGLWQWVGSDDIPFSLPTFTGTMTVLWDYISGTELWGAFGRSNQALLLGFGMSLGIGVTLGLVMGLADIVSRVAQPYVTVMVAVPTISLIPLVQSVFGLSLLARAVVVFLFSFAYLTSNTFVAVRTVRTDMKEMATSFGAGRGSLIRHVILPASVPGITAGIRLGLGRALVGMVIAELTLVGAGIGSLIAEAQGRVRIPDVTAISFAVIVEGIVLMGLVGLIEKRFAGWEGRA